MDAMNLLGYDAMALGALDLRLGLDVLRQRMEEADFPVLSANAVISGTDRLFTLPYITKKMRDHEVAIIGLTNADAIQTSGGAIAIYDPLKALQYFTEEMSAKADIIIVLSRLDMEEDLELANEMKGIDLIVGGRDVLNPPVWDEENRTVTARAGIQGQWIGVVRLGIDSEGTVANHEGELVLLTEDVADDPEMMAFLDRYK